MSDFSKERSGTGTHEWAETTFNIARGCSNACLYCYARHNAMRFKRIQSREEWQNEVLTANARIERFPAKKGVVMYPSAHDITPATVNGSVSIIRHMLDSGNQVLVVTKANPECIRQLMMQLDKYPKDRLLFRVTMGSMESGVSRFWEPGAPLPFERLTALKLLFHNDYKTSVSIEPMLEGLHATVAVVEAVKSYVTEKIWIGKMNKPRLRVDMSIAANREAVAEVEQYQCDEEIMALHLRLEDDPQIAWKDSIKKVIAAQENSG
jgi:DNA repair photolyase